MRKSLKGYQLCVLSSLFIGAACSFGQHMNAKDAPCQPPSTTVEETDCFASALTKADSNLNQLYHRVLTVVDGDKLVKLKTAQLLWIQFRDANCDAEQELYSGGSTAPMVKLACLEAMTRHRTEELNVIFGWRLEKCGK
jgi:uncharacterized protein YecT (DUF1311 family)